MLIWLLMYWSWWLFIKLFWLCRSSQLSALSVITAKCLKGAPIIYPQLVYSWILKGEKKQIVGLNCSTCRVNCFSFWKTKNDYLVGFFCRFGGLSWDLSRTTQKRKHSWPFKVQISYFISNQILNCIMFVPHE